MPRGGAGLQVLEVTDRIGPALKGFNAATALHRVARHAADDAHVKETTRQDERFVRLLDAVRAPLAKLQPRVRTRQTLTSRECPSVSRERVGEPVGGRAM